LANKRPKLIRTTTGTFGEPEHRGGVSKVAEGAKVGESNRKQSEGKAKGSAKARFPYFRVWHEWAGCWVALSHTKCEHDAFSERAYYKATVFKKVCRRCIGFMVPLPPKVAPSVHPTSIGCRFHKRRAATKTPAVATQNGLQKTYASPKCVIKSGYDWNSIVICPVGMANGRAHCRGPEYALREINRGAGSLDPQGRF
jgi:hypothetical protein